MGKATGFLEYEREVGKDEAPEEQIKNWNKFHAPLSEEEQRHQGARCIDYGVSFCQSDITISGMVSGYPLHNSVPEWDDLVCTGNWKRVYSRLEKTNSFPELTSRVRPVPCKAACTCSLYRDAVTVKENERAIIEKACDSECALPNPPSIRTGKKVAVIGSGPVGLATADQLNKRGHRITVFERNDRVDDLLMYGIPNTKLEKWVIDRKVDVMKKEGVTFAAGAGVGRSYRVNKMRKEFGHTIPACGASDPRDIDIPGRGSAGIYFAVDFLKAITKSLLDSGLKNGNCILTRDRRMLVIGSGDTGNDCVGTPIRHGCASVTQLEIVPRPPVERAENNTWPEWPRIFKTDYDQEEAISIFSSDPRQYQTTVEEFIKDGENRVCKAIITNLIPRKDEETGRTVMATVKGSGREIPANLVLIAASLTGTQTYITGALGVELDARANVATECGTYRTSMDQILTAGGVHQDQLLVVQAIQESRETAKAVDRDIMGYTNLVQLAAPRTHKSSEPPPCSRTNPVHAGLSGATRITETPDSNHQMFNRSLIS